MASKSSIFAIYKKCPDIRHWGSLLLAVVLAYTLLSAGSMPRATTGMVILLLFALVTFSTGYTWIGDSWA